MPCCSSCLCPVVKPLGTLGTRDWFRCYDCGGEFSTAHAPAESDPEGGE